MFACNHPGYGRNREDVKKLFIENMQILTEHAEKIGQTIILEPVTPYEGTIIVTSDDVRWALDQVDSPYFKCMLDLAAPFTSGEPICAYFEKMGSDVKHIHFVDCDGYLSLELFSRYANEPDFSAERGYKVIRGLLDEN